MSQYSEPIFSIGIEEEYLLVDLESREAVIEQPPELMQRCKAAFDDHVTGEFLKSQIEIGTRPCNSVQDAGQHLRELRRGVADIANQFGMAPIAASTHPFSNWRDQKSAENERYIALSRNMRAVVHRMLICGMHVHCGIEDPDLRIDLMNQVRYFLPHLLALSTSSPFWGGIKTGLMSYRLTVFDGLPRRGLPDRFESYGEYERLVSHLTRAGIIDDATMIWWDLRPSARFPTLEMRIADISTSIDDTICIAALYRCILRMLYRLRTLNQRWRIYPALFILENRWRAQRYGPTETLVDFGIGEQVPYADLLGEVMGLIGEDAAALDCEAEVKHAFTILERGTSAQNQLKVYDAAIAAGKDEKAALREVVDWLIAETVAGTEA